MEYIMTINSDLKLTEEFIDIMKDEKDYVGIVINGLRPYTADAAYMKEVIHSQSKIPYKFYEEDELKNMIEETKLKKITSGRLSLTKLTLLMSALEPGFGAELAGIDKMIMEEISSNRRRKAIGPKKNRKLPDTRYYTRHPYDTRTHKRR